MSFASVLKFFSDFLEEIEPALVEKIQFNYSSKSVSWGEQGGGRPYVLR